MEKCVCGRRFADLEITDGADKRSGVRSREKFCALITSVAAVPQDVLLELLPADVTASQPSLRSLKQLKTSPITGVHFWLDRVLDG